MYGAEAIFHNMFGTLDDCNIKDCAEPTEFEARDDDLAETNPDQQASDISDSEDEKAAAVVGEGAEGEGEEEETDAVGEKVKSAQEKLRR